MKKYKMCLPLLAVLLMLVLCGCTQGTPEREPTPCDICGGTADKSVYGALEYLLQKGVPSSKCYLVTGALYSANVCNECDASSVVEITPD